ncbi:MAG: PilN domain-containing protein [Ramlibacter sp.]|nr:PilN domain-containing protein [Ramlibacter sp.]
MILINLLPHREAARKRRRESFYVSLGAAALVGGVIAGAVFLWYQAQISAQRSRNTVLQSENARLDKQIKDIATLQGEIAALRARQQAVEDLQSDRNVPVHLLNELVAQLPDGVYVSTMRQENLRVTLQGVAQSNERVSELLRNLANSSPWLARPELVEIVATTVSLSPRDQRRVSNFTIRVGLNRPTNDAKGDGAVNSASRPAGSSSAAAGPK